MAATYELQSKGDAGWRLESVYTTLDPAIADARRLHEGAPALGVRVVERGGESSAGKLSLPRTVFEASPLAPSRYLEAAPAAPLSGRRRDEIERHNEEARERRLLRHRIVSRVREEHKRLDRTLRMLTWRSAAIAAIAIAVLTVAAKLLG
jgi:hypothetical protein